MMTYTIREIRDQLTGIIKDYKASGLNNHQIRGSCMYMMYKARLKGLNGASTSLDRLVDTEERQIKAHTLRYFRKHEGNN